MVVMEIVVVLIFEVVVVMENVVVVPIMQEICSSGCHDNCGGVFFSFVT